MGKQVGQEYIAALPAQVIYIAAQFASSDETKHPLNCICISSEGDNLAIMSTDGHRAFRFRFHSSDLFWSSKSFCIPAKPLRKRIAKANMLDVKPSQLFLIDCDSVLLSRMPVSVLDSAGYPNVDQLFPDSFKNEPGRPMGFCSRYLAQFLNEVTRFTDNEAVMMECNTPTSPAKFTSQCSIPLLQSYKLEYLLMPVQLRGSWWQ